MDLWCILDISYGGGVEAIAGLIPIQLHLKKMAERANLRVATLTSTHPTRSLLSGRHVKDAVPHYLSLDSLAPGEAKKVKSTIREIAEALPTLTEEFDPSDVS